MSAPIIRIEIRYEQDVVHVRQQARLVADLLGFGQRDQTRISTAASEIARNAYQYGKGGTAEFLVEGEPPPRIFTIRVRDCGPGIEHIDDVLAGRFTSRTGMGLGITGARRLMDHFHIETGPGRGTMVCLEKNLPDSAPAVTPQALARIADTLVRTKPETHLEEIRRQNRELLASLADLGQRHQESIRLNQELEDTNRGVLALYTELDEQALQLRRSTELKSRFLSHMSHEVRTPLNAILALSRLLLDRADGDLTEEQEKQVAFIHQAANDLTALVNDLLDLAKIEAGKTVVHPNRCLAEEIFSGLRGMMRPMLASKKVRLVFENAEGIPPLYTDEGKVSQILRNLLSNAFKFTGEGEIRVSARLSEDGDAVIFSVADTGIGIAPKDRERIFEEYAQVAGSEGSRIKGTGLGLSISRALAQMLGGSIRVESRPGVGSTFFVALPLRYAASEEAAGTETVTVAPGARHPAPAADRDARNQKPNKALVIDDDATARYILAGYLADAGVGLAETERPDLVFLDLVMPGMSGFEVCNTLKDHPATRHIPILIVTSRILDEEETRTLREQALAILSKQALSREVVIRAVQKGLMPGEEALSHD